MSFSMFDYTAYFVLWKARLGKVVSIKERITYNYQMAVPLTEVDIVIRLCLAFVAGGVIGLERSSRRQVAGLRTHILIALGAACLMLLSIWLPQNFNAGADPGRIAAQVVSGIGFLGAGAIIRLGNNIRGLTTAASLWLTAAIGMTVGAGMYAAALTAAVLALITLMALNKVEKKIFPDDWQQPDENKIKDNKP
jgi:putative Mg2+ transporter-C (MgtC) family protein